MHQLVRRCLQNSANSTNQRANANCPPSSILIHNDTAEQRAKHGAAAKRGIDGSNGRRRRRGGKEIEEVLGRNHVRHDTGVVAKKE